MSESGFISDQHKENVEWSSKLDFYKDEIEILQKRLDEIASKNTRKEVLISVEYFQNQLTIHRNTIDEIQHGVNVSEDRLLCEVKKNPVASDHRKTGYHQAEKEEIQILEKAFKELREEFNRFVSKWI